MKSVKILYSVVFAIVLTTGGSLAAHSQGWIDDDLLGKIFIVNLVLVGLCFIVNLGGWTRAWMRYDELTFRRSAKVIRDKNDQSHS